MERTLRDVFGLDKLRPGQAEVIRSVLEGNNTLAIMPTGAGKSLCYQLPTLHIHGATVIVSPLIALMKDQVDKLEDAGARRSEEKAAKDREKLERMMQYGQSAACRWRLLHEYFGEPMNGEQCGTCDNCVNPLEEQLGLPDVRKSVGI